MASKIVQALVNVTGFDLKSEDGRQPVSVTLVHTFMKCADEGLGKATLEGVDIMVRNGDECAMEIVH